MSLPKLLLLKHSCMYAKRGGVAAYHIVWIGLCLRSVPVVRTPGTLLQHKQHIGEWQHSSTHSETQH